MLVWRLWRELNHVSRLSQNPQVPTGRQRSQDLKDTRRRKRTLPPAEARRREEASTRLPCSSSSPAHKTLPTIQKQHAIANIQLQNQYINNTNTSTTPTMAPKPGLLPEMTMHRRKQSMAPSLPNPVDLCRFNKIMAGELKSESESEPEPFFISMKYTFVAWALWFFDLLGRRNLALMR